MKCETILFVLNAEDLLFLPYFFCTVQIVNNAFAAVSVKRLDSTVVYYVYYYFLLTVASRLLSAMLDTLMAENGGGFNSRTEETAVPGKI